MPDSSSPTRPAADPARRRPALLIVLAVILALEALLVTGLAAWLLYELLAQIPQSYATAIAITVLVALAAAWVVATLVGLLRLHAWARASTVTIQVLMVAVGVGSFEGLLAGPDVGWALLVPAVVAGVLALAPSVVRATTRSGDRNTEKHE